MALTPLALERFQTDKAQHRLILTVLDRIDEGHGTLETFIDSSEAQDSKIASDIGDKIQDILHDLDGLRVTLRLRWEQSKEKSS